jgi:hypothetical protein
VALLRQPAVEIRQRSRHYGSHGLSHPAAEIPEDVKP